MIWNFVVWIYAIQLGYLDGKKNLEKVIFHFWMDWKSLKIPLLSPATTEEASMTPSGCSLISGLWYLLSESPLCTPPHPCVSFNKLTEIKQANLEEQNCGPFHSTHPVATWLTIQHGKKGLRKNTWSDIGRRGRENDHLTTRIK